MRIAITVCVVCVLLLSSVAMAGAQDTREIQVNGADMVSPTATTSELHSNFTASGRNEVLDGGYATNHAIHETVEITWLTLARV